MRAMRGTRPAAETSGLEGVFGKIAKLNKSGADITLDDAEALRKATARLAWPSPTDALSMKHGDRTRVEAKRFYNVLSTAMERSFPQYRDALRSGKVLRDMERSLKEVQTSDIDDATARAFFTGKDVMKRLDVLSQNSTPQDIGSLKGWYFSQLVHASTGANGLDPKKLETALRSQKFNSQVVEKFLPGAIDELRDHARLTSKMLGSGAGRFAPEGSQTMGRQVIAQLFQNPYAAFIAILSPIGARFALKSAMGGQVEDALQRLSRQGPTPITRSAVAAQQAVPKTLAPYNQSVLGIQGGSQ